MNNIKLSAHEARDVRRLVLSARLSLHLSRDCLKRGDVERARYYRIEVRKALYNARYILAASRVGGFDPQMMYSRSRLIAVFPKLPQDKLSEVAQDDSGRVSAASASSGLRLFRVSCVKNGRKSMQAVRCAFSRVSSGWAPLPGKRSLVGRESQVRLPSFKQSPP